MKTLRMTLIALPLLGGVLLFGPDLWRPGQSDGIRVASKGFTESVVLGEIIRQRLRAAGVPSTHREQLGGTRVLWSALLQGDIDAYPEYTGTLAREILGDPSLDTEAKLRAAVEARGLRMSRPLGFHNGYALGMTRPRAKALGLTRVSELRQHPELRLGFTNEFLNRSDGWPSLKQHYLLDQKDVRGLDHDLAYQALVHGSIDVTDLYTTDAKILKFDLALLEDDAHHFPRYDAIILYRATAGQDNPNVSEAIRALEGTIPVSRMMAMNARVETEGLPEALAAAEFLRDDLGLQGESRQQATATRILQRVREHLLLVLISLSAAIVTAVPLGIWAARRSGHGQVILAVVGIIQTIPSLALLVFLMKPLSELAGMWPGLRDWGIAGIGNAPAIGALYLYSLLPIVRNTASGLSQMTPGLRESAEALGMGSLAKLWRIELPLAGPTILAGVKTAAVVNIGFATLGALIGAGGLGQPILTGIRLNDYALILQGAAPAAALALITQAWFELVERIVVPRGLRLAAS